MKIVAKTLLFDTSGQILLLRRSHTHPRFAGHFDLPGGEVELGENAAMAVAREIQEETGLAVAAASLREVFDIEKDDSLRHVLLQTTLSTHKPQITVSWEHDLAVWKPLNEALNEPLPSGVDEYYADAITYVAQKRSATINKESVTKKEK